MKETDDIGFSPEALYGQISVAGGHLCMDFIDEIKRRFTNPLSSEIWDVVSEMVNNIPESFDEEVRSFLEYLIETQAYILEEYLLESLDCFAVKQERNMPYWVLFEYRETRESPPLDWRHRT